MSWETKNDIKKTISLCVPNYNANKRGGGARGGTGEETKLEEEGREEADHLRGRERLWKFFTFISSLKTKSKLKCQKVAI